MGLTDHGKWRPSAEAIEKFADVPIDLLLCHGEEVHLKGGYMHLVNFASDYSVNELFYENEDKIHAMLEKEAGTEKTPRGVNALEYVYRRWACMQIRKKRRTLYCSASVLDSRTVSVQYALENA